MPAETSKESISDIIPESKENLPIQHITAEANCDNSMLEKLSPEAKQRFEKFGLENMYFKMHTEDCLDLEEVKAKIKRGESNVYVLAHGWTGTNEMWDSVHKPPKGRTIVEEILLADPNAVIICPDGDGFGKSKFKNMSQEELESKCGPEDYAEHIEFMLDEVFEIPKDKRERVFMMGHSLGGAMVTVAAGRGYVPAENCIAICPAFLPNFEGNKNFSDKQTGQVQLRYAALSKVMALAEGVKNMHRYAEGVTDAVVDKVATLMLAAPLMGAEFPGSIPPEDFETIIKELFRIHIPEIRKTNITSAVMTSLSRGVELSKDEYDVEKMANVTKIMGEKDILAPKMSSATGITSLLDFREPIESEGVQLVRDAGHIAVVYESGAMSPTRQLLAKVQEQNYKYYFEFDRKVKEKAAEV